MLHVRIAIQHENVSIYVYSLNWSSTFSYNLSAPYVKYSTVKRTCLD